METNYNIPTPPLHLELGDWVTVKTGLKGEKQTQPMYVTGIFDSGVYLEFDARQGDPFECDCKDITPIPLTDEIIDINDIRKDMYVYSEYGRIVVSAKRENAKSAIIKRCYPLYVHELQHIMRLCGMTKQVIL